MEPRTAKWWHCLLYLFSIFSILFLFHTQIAHKLLLGHHKLHVKRSSPDLPLRFRSDGTFKILQVFVSLFLGFLVLNVLFNCFCKWVFDFEVVLLILNIEQVADMHYGTGVLTRCRDVLSSEFDYCSDLNTTRFLNRMIQHEKPDFIAFTGPADGMDTRLTCLL
uniref:Phosphatase DCR2 n=1 Tax=Rhizophora mucronata TaxID=61149 RepID=A0A2P2KAJ6_RHIMU